MGLKSLTAIIPIGGHTMPPMKGGKSKEYDEDAEPDEEDEDTGDGLRESFDELADDLDIPDDKRDSAFEKLRGFMEQVAHQCYRDEKAEPAGKDEDEE